MTRKTSPHGWSGQFARGAPLRGTWRSESMPWARKNSSRAVQDAGDLGDRTAHLLRVQPGGDPADVRQARHGEHAAAAEVQAVELHFVRGVGERERRDQRAQQRRLAGLRTADDQHVAGRAGEVQVQHVTALLERLVHEADRHDQPARARCTPARAGRAPAWRERRQQLVQRGGSSSGGSHTWWAGGPWPSQPPHDHVEHGVGERVVVSRRAPARAGVRVRDASAPATGSRREQHAARRSVRRAAADRAAAARRGTAPRRTRP